MAFYREADSFVVTDPRIPQIRRELERLLAIVDLEKDGQPVLVDGFRLRHLSHWVGHVTDTSMNALTPISGLCNSRCEFCFEENIPFARERTLMPLSEAATRLAYFDPQTGACLFPSNRPHMEPFVHPNAIEIIEMARKRQPGQLFWITTNGSHLDEARVERLASLQPLMIKLSINVADPGLNKQLMKTRSRISNGIRAPQLLQNYGIPFMGSIVAWPTLPLEAIQETVRYLEQHRAYAIRIRLPLTHRYLNCQLQVDFDSHWREVIDFAHALRSQVSVPLFVEPPIYWVKAIAPEVDGVVLNSPAHLAGVRAGDVIREINGQSIRTRTESETTLFQERLSGKPLDVMVERAGFLLSLHSGAPESSDTYPYNGETFYKGENYGIFHVEDFRFTTIEQVATLMSEHSAMKALLFLSPAVAELVHCVIKSVPEFQEQFVERTLYTDSITKPRLGGNFYVMDSRFVEDYERAIQAHLDRGYNFDLIIIPDVFGSPWGTDMTGESCARLAMKFGIPVERIDCLTVYGREV